MASSREIARVCEDPVLARSIAEALIQAEPEALDDWEEPFVKSLVESGHIDRLSERQGEKLLQARDGAQFIASHQGVSIAQLLDLCHQARLDLGEADEDWIVERWSQSRTEIRRRHVKQLLRCVRQLRLH